MNRNEQFVKSLYVSIVEPNLKHYDKMLNTELRLDIKIDEYWFTTLEFYQKLSDKEKHIIMNMTRQTIIDTISSVLGIIDGSSTLYDCDLEPKLLLDNIDTEGELQDEFLEYVEEKYME